MPLEIRAIPCLRDNYAYLVHDPGSGATAVVDVPEAAPIIGALEQAGWTLGDILITHHHTDHVGGVEQLRAATGASVLGARADAHRLPALDRMLDAGDTVTIGTQAGQVLDASGHTVGLVAYYFAQAGLAFTSDSLMSLGCGRLFEGSAAQMWDTLSRLMALPDDTLICTGHDYLDGNAAFALSIEPQNADLHARIAQATADRAAGRPMAMAPLSIEKATNPFLRAAMPHIKESLGLSAADDLSVFAELRRRKDAF